MQPGAPPGPLPLDLSRPSSYAAGVNGEAQRPRDYFATTRWTVVLNAAGTDPVRAGDSLADLCNALIAALDEHDQAAVKAGYRAAQANNNTRVTSPDLEIRRNYMMSWTQYAKELNQRAEIARQMNNQVALAGQQVRVDWANRIAQLRLRLDELYRLYREAVRQDPSFQKPQQNFTSANPPPVQAAATATPAPSPVAPTAIEIPANVKELFTAEFRALPEDEQFKRIVAKLKELNPGFKGNLPQPNKNGVARYMGAQLVNLWPLRAMTGVTEFRLKKGVHDLSPLAGMPLQGLRIPHTSVSDLTPLAGMPLERLFCQHTRVTDLSPLKTMKHLRELSCDFKPARHTEILRLIKTLKKSLTACRRQNFGSK